jgi:hypothetical protein
MAVTPVIEVASTVSVAADAFWIERFSIPVVKKPEMLFAPAAASVPDAVIDRVSVPVPPVKLSPAFNVLTAAVAVSLRMVELKVSLAVPPVKDAPVSSPVVSDLLHDS